MYSNFERSIFKTERARDLDRQGLNHPPYNNNNNNNNNKKNNASNITRDRSRFADLSKNEFVFNGLTNKRTDKQTYIRFY